MAGSVSGIATTFGLPNFHGELFSLTPSTTPLLSLSGGLSGGKQTNSPAFEWQTEDLRDASIRTRLEGATAPAGEERVRANVENICQIFHEAVETSYTKAAATGQYSTPGSAPFYGDGTGEPNPVSDEHAHQVMIALKQISRDVNYAFWHGKKVKPTDNTVARTTGGLLPSITTNRTVATEYVGASAATDTITVTHALANGDKVTFSDVGASTALSYNKYYYVVNVATTVSFKVSATLGGAAITIGTATVSVVKAATPLTVLMVNQMCQGVFDNGGIVDEQTATLFVSSRQKIALTAAYAAAYGQARPFGITRNIAGFDLDTVVTDFGTMNVVIDRALAPDAMVMTSLEQIEPVFLSIPGKGVMFEEELAKIGASDRTQIYGEVGLKYGNQLAHGVLRGLAI